MLSIQIASSEAEFATLKYRKAITEGLLADLGVERLVDREHEKMHELSTSI